MVKVESPCKKKHTISIALARSCASKVVCFALRCPKTRASIQCLAGHIGRMQEAKKSCCSSAATEAADTWDATGSADVACFRQTRAVLQACTIERLLAKAWPGCLRRRQDPSVAASICPYIFICPPCTTFRKHAEECSKATQTLA